MNDQIEIVNTLFKELDRVKALSELVLVGSWCQYVYQNSVEFKALMQEASAIRTTDIDFMIPNKGKIKREINLAELFNKMGFIEDRKRNGLIKYQMQNIDLEFITVARGKREQHIIEIDKLKINAVPLNYMNLLEAYITKVNYNGIKINVPEPEAFALHKFIISDRRIKKDKAAKDLATAIEYFNILVADTNRQKRLKQVYNELIPAWKKTLKRILQKHDLNTALIE